MKPYHEIDLSGIIEHVEDVEKDPLFSFSDDPVQNQPEGILVSHETLGVGYVLRPEKWIMHKIDMGEFDNTTHTMVAFFGYSPVVICENEFLTIVKPNMIRWRSLLKESGIKTSSNWFAPAAVHNNVHKKDKK